jgi:hypothetical protein
VFEGREAAELLFPAGPYSHHVAEHLAFDYRLDTAALRDGWNEVLLVHGGSPAEPVDVVALELAVKPA